MFSIHALEKREFHIVCLFLLLLALALQFTLATVGTSGVSGPAAYNGVNSRSDGPMFPPNPWERADGPMVPPNPWERADGPMFPPNPWERA